MSHPAPDPLNQPSTEPVSPGDVRPGDQVWHPFHRLFVTVTSVDLAATSWPGGVPAVAIHWTGQEGLAGVMMRTASDGPVRRFTARCGRTLA